MIGRRTMPWRSSTSSSIARMYPQLPSAFEPPSGTTYGRPPVPRIRSASSASSRLRSRHAGREIQRSSAPTRRSSKMLPVGAGGRRVVGAQDQHALRMPSWAAAIAVARAWLDCSPPQVITCVACWAIGLGGRYSSFRTLISRQLAAGLVVALDPDLRARRVAQPVPARQGSRAARAAVRCRAAVPAWRKECHCRVAC